MSADREREPDPPRAQRRGPDGAGPVRERPPGSPAAALPARMARLQGAAGNAAVAALIGGRRPSGAAPGRPGGGVASGGGVRVRSSGGPVGGAPPETATDGGVRARDNAAAAPAGGTEPGGVAGAAPVPAPPAPPRDPHRDPRFAGMVTRVAAAAADARTMTPPPAAAAAAQAAAVPPGDDRQSQASAAQLDEMAQREPGVFDRAGFIDAVRRAVDAAAPSNLGEADEFRSGGAAKVKGQVAGLVKGGTEDSRKDIKQATHATPDASKAQSKPVTPMPPERDVTLPGSVGAPQALPQPAPAGATDLASGPASVDREMADAGVTDEQLRRSNEPAFGAALKARQDARDHAREAPEAFRKQEAGVLGGATAEVSAVEGGHLRAMGGARAEGVAGALGHQRGAKGADEARRAKVATDVRGIYERTKADVQRLLDGLDPKVDAVFSEGEGAARAAFERSVAARMDAYKRHRYSGIEGAALWVRDKVLRMPAEVDTFYREGRAAYLADMEAVVGRVADVVGEGLSAARARIAEGRAEAHRYVVSLPRELQEVGREAERNLTEQWDRLRSDVESKQHALVDAVAERYVRARTTIDQRIDEMKAANGGLVDKALGAVRGVVGTIMQLKEMLLGVLGRAAGVIQDIIADPIGFLGKLVDGVKAGLGRFVANIGAHVQRGLMGWLFGTLGAAGIEMPKTLNLKAILDIALQIFGLTYRNIRARVAGLVGEKAVARMEQTVEVFKTLAREGVGGLWTWIKDRVGGLEDMILGQIRSFIIERVIRAGVTWLIAFLNPAAAFIKACKAIYDIVMFVIERGREMIEFANSIIDSVGAIAKGSIGVVAQKVEDSLSRALPLAISFLASLLGLGGISDKIRGIIQKVQAPINKAVDFIVMGAVKAFRRTFGGAIAWGKGKLAAGKQWAKGKVEAGKQWVKGKVAKPAGERAAKGGVLDETAFDVEGDQHHVTVRSEPGARIITVASTPERGWREFLDLHASTAKTDATKKLVVRARTVASAIEKLAETVAESRNEGERRERLGRLHTRIGEFLTLIRPLLKGRPLARLVDRYRLEGQVGRYGELTDAKGDGIEKDHQPPAAIIKHAASLREFAGRAIQGVAAGHANGGWAINLHDARHRQGLSWRNRDAYVTRAKTALSAMSGSGPPDVVRARVMQKLVELRGNEASAILGAVRSRDIVHPVWSDIAKMVASGEISTAEAKALIDYIADQVETGEARITSQELGYERPGAM